MSDTIGAYSVSITPDVSDFPTQLADLLSSALQDAVDQFARAGKDMAAALTDGLVPALGDATSQVADASMAMGDTLATGLSDGLDAATSAVSTSTQEMSDQIQSALDATLAIANEDVLSGSEQMAESVRGSLGPAAQESADQARDEFGRFAIDGAAAADDAKEEVGSRFEGLGDIIKGVAIGDLIAKSVEEGTKEAITSLEEITDFLPELGEKFQETFNQMTIATGATGPALDTLKVQFNDVFGTIPAKASDVGHAIDKVTVVLGQSGQEAEDTARRMLQFGNIAGGDVAGNVDKLTGLFKLFNTSTGNQTEEMDRLLRISQQTQVPLGSLINQVGTMAPKLDAAGFSIDEVAGLVGQLGKAGVPVGPVLMGINKEAATLQKEGKNAHDGLMQIFDQVQRAPTMEAAGKIASVFGARAGPLLAKQLQEGNLNIEQLLATIDASGDTIEGAEERTLTWQERLGMLTDTLEKRLEPVATFVFNQMGVVVEEVSPIIDNLAGIVGRSLFPALSRLLEIGAPIWQMFGRIREGFEGFVAALQNGGDAFDGIRNFFESLTGDADAADQISEQIHRVAETLGEVWDAAEPLREALSSVFDRVREAVQTFIDTHPDVAFAAFAATIGSLLVPALSILGTVIGVIVTTIGGFLFSVIAAAAPIIAVAAAVGALVAALVYAYDNIGPFHDAVVAVAYVISTALLGGFQDLSEFVENSVLPWLTALVDLIPRLWEALTAGDAHGVGQILDTIFGNTGEYVDAFSEAFTTVVGVFDIVRSAVTEFATQVETAVFPALSHLLDVLGGGQGIMQWLTDHWQILAAALLAVIGPVALLIGGLVVLYVKFEPVREVIGQILTAIYAFTGALLNVAVVIVGDVINAVTALIEIFQGLFTLDWDKVGAGLADLGKSILTVLADITSQVPDLIIGLITKVTDAILGQLAKIPIIGNLFDGLKTIIDGVGTTLSGLFEIITGILTLNWDTIKDGLGNALGGIRDMLAGLFGGIGGFLRDLIVQGLPVVWDGIKAAAPALLEAFAALLANLPGWLFTALLALGTVIQDGLGFAWDSVLEAAPKMLEAFGQLLANLPGWILTALLALGTVIQAGVSAAFDFIVANGPTILAGVVSWLISLPGQMLGWLGNLGLTLIGWLVDGFAFVIANQMAFLGAIFDFITGLPGRFLSLLAESLSFLFTFLVEAAQWAVANGPGIIEGLIGFFQSLPGRIWDAIGNLGQFLVDHVFIPAAIWIVINGPGIINGILDFFRSLPGRLVDTMSDLAGRLVVWVANAFLTLIVSLPGIVQGVIDFFESVPGRIFDAIRNGLGSIGGALTDFAKSIWQTIAHYLNEKLLDPIRNFTVTIVGQDMTPFAGVPRLIETFARGGIVDRPTFGMFGEAGAEALIPLTDPIRGASIARAAGIPAMLAAQGGGPSNVINLTVNVEATPDTTPEHARDVGDTAASAAAERLISMRSRILAS